MWITGCSSYYLYYQKPHEEEIAAGEDKQTGTVLPVHPLRPSLCFPTIQTLLMLSRTLQLKIAQRNYIFALKGKRCNVSFEMNNSKQEQQKPKDGMLSLPAHCPIDFKKDLGKTFRKCRKMHLENLTHFTRYTRHTSSPTKTKKCSRASPMMAPQQPWLQIWLGPPQAPWGVAAGEADRHLLESASAIHCVPTFRLE